MRREKMIIAAAGVLFFAFCSCVWLKPAAQYSASERRMLAQTPKLSIESVADGSFMSGFESYALDQFPMRDAFRSFQAWMYEKIFRKSDHHEVYVSDGYAVKMEYPLNEASLENAASKFQKLYTQYLEGNNCNIYMTIVPDKNYFLAEKSGHLSMDYERLFEKMQQGMPYAQTIEIAGFLEIEDYYKTDIHWRQEMLTDAAKEIAAAMGAQLSASYDVRTLEEEFFGVYSGQAAFGIFGEALSYLTNEGLEECTVYNYETGKTTGIYDMEKAEGKDPYEMFLSGSVSLLKIENPNAFSEKELVVFRDSFGSSLVPLLAESYQSITLVDIRYIQSGLVGKFVDFQGKDVLFLYSTSVLNHSETLK